MLAASAVPRARVRLTRPELLDDIALLAVNLAHLLEVLNVPFGAVGSGAAIEGHEVLGEEVRALHAVGGALTTLAEGFRLLEAGRRPNRAGVPP